MSKIFIVMPAYNEADNIETTIRQWYPVLEKLKADGNDCEMVIASDGSSDNTYSIMKGLSRDFPMLTPVNKENSGHGATLIYLYRYAIKEKADFVFQTDSDGQTNPDEFWQMWGKKDSFDIQIGKRTQRQDGVGRVLVSFVLKILVWLMFQEWVKDPNTPFRLMRTDSLKTILTYIPDDFFLSNVAISAIAKKKRVTIGWIPITFKPRQGGKNSINLRRIVVIGIKAIGDFSIIKRNLK